ncbi:MAG: hypothetical protein HY961_03235 [Ignavibacteriae bacterium]|nr:hypothetical protein [Ignavibacteriota bacterium]
MIRSFVLTLLLGCLDILHAQFHEHSVEFLNSDNGLSQNSVHSIYQDSIGFMWFGTADGLNRFDGYTIESYSRDATKGNPTTTDRAGAIAEWNGRLWVGWDMGGLSWFDRTTERVELLETKLGMQSIESLHPDGQKRMWVGTTRGLYAVTQEGDRFACEMASGVIGDELLSEYIPSIARDSHGALYFATYHGVVKWDARDCTHSRVSTSSDARHKISSDSVRAVFCSRDGTVWFGSRRGLDALLARSDSVVKGVVKNIDVATLYEDEHGTLWIGTEKDGLFAFDRNSKEAVRIPLSTGSSNAIVRYGILSILRDRFGSLWVGTRSAGAAKIDRDKIEFRFYQTTHRDAPNIRRRAVWSFALSSLTDGKTVFVGTGASLTEVELASGNILENWRSAHAVRAVVEDNSEPGVLWLGTLGGGLVKLVHSPLGMIEDERYLTNPLQDKESCIYALHQDPRGTLWMGTNGAGLLSFDPSSRSAKQYPMTVRDKPVSWILSICEGRQGEYWLGTWRQGLIRFDVKTNEWKSVRLEESSHQLPDDLTILSICRDERNENLLWLGTNGNGLVQYDCAAGRAKRYNEADGLANNAVFGVVQDGDGMLWLTTNHGLSRFSPTTNAFTNFHFEDGLQGNGFNLGAMQKGSGGAVLVGGNNGFNCFFPNKKMNTTEPRTILTSVHSFNTMVYGMQWRSDGPSLSLSHDQRYLSFSFVGLHYKNTGKNRYAYKMEGFDTGWIATTNRRAEYSVLPFGEYVFKVKAANADGIWNREPFRVAVDVQPPFWMTTWFWGICTAAGVCIALGIQRYRILSALRIERAAHAEQERLRNRMAADYHDELGARAAKISLAADLIGAETAPTDGRISRQLLQLATHATQLVNSVREMSWQFDPDRDSLMDLAIYLKDFSDELFNATCIAFQLEGLSADFERIRLSMDWRQELSRIFKEGMTNILKHSKKSCNVTLSFQVVSGRLCVELMDDGCGFKIDVVQRGHGMTNMTDRAMKLGGHLEIASVPGRGTKIRFEGKLP